MTSINTNYEDIKWPPTEEQIKTIASSALNTTEEKNVKVLVYWLNDPKLMIFNPFCYANTEYIKRKYKVSSGRSVFVEIGKED